MNVKIKVMNEKNKSLKCAKWLSKCISFGWEKESIPALEKLWNDNHDEKGNLIKSAIPKQKVDDTEVWDEVSDRICDILFESNGFSSGADMIINELQKHFTITRNKS